LTDDETPPAPTSDMVETDTASARDLREPQLRRRSARLLIVAGVVCLVLSITFSFRWSIEIGDHWLGPPIGDFTPLTVAGVVLLSVGILFLFDFVGAIEKATRREVNSSDIQGGVNIHGNVSGGLSISYPENYNPAQAILAHQLGRSSEGLRKQESILQEIYIIGIAQARLSFYVSIFFAAVGAILIFTGVGLAIWRAPSDSQRYASIVSALSGMVVTLTSALFFAQANSTRKNMGNQGAMLREESQDDRRIGTVREMVASVSNEAARDELQSHIARALISGIVHIQGMNPEPAVANDTPE
jgi:hypothetical protein